MVFHLLGNNVSYRNASDAAAAVLLRPLRVWAPHNSSFFSECFPLRPQGSLICGEKEQPLLNLPFSKRISSAPRFKKKIHVPNLLSALFFPLSHPHRFPNVSRKAGLNQPPGFTICLFLSHTHFSSPSLLKGKQLRFCPLSSQHNRWDPDAYGVCTYV